MYFQSPTSIPNVSARLQSFQIDLQPTWVISLLLIFFYRLWYVPFSLYLLDALNLPCLHFDLQPLILMSVMYPWFQIRSLTRYIVADTVGIPQLDL